MVPYLQSVCCAEWRQLESKQGAPETLPKGGRAETVPSYFQGQKGLRADLKKRSEKNIYTHTPYGGIYVYMCICINVYNSIRNVEFTVGSQSQLANIAPRAQLPSLVLFPAASA